MKHEGFALQRISDGSVQLHTYSTTEEVAMQLLEALKLHHRHAGAHRVVPVVIEVTVREATP